MKKMIAALSTALLITCFATVALAAESSALPPAEVTAPVTEPAAATETTDTTDTTDTTEPAEPAVPEVKTLSLAQAMEIALTGNHQVELAALGVEKAELSLDQALFAKEKMLNFLDNSNSNPDQDATRVIEVIPVQVQSGKVIADAAQSYTLNSIKYGVEAAYYAVLRAEKLLVTVENSYKRADVQYIQAQAKFRVGVSPKIDVIAAEAQRKAAAADVNSAKASLAMARMSFNQTLGLDLDTPLVLTDKFDFLAPEVADSDAVFDDQQVKDLGYVTASETMKINQVGFDFAKKYYTTNTFLYRDAAYQHKQAEANLQAAQSTLELNIKTAALNLQTAEDNYNTLTKSLAQAREAYRLTKLRFDVGMATNYEVLSSEDALNQVELGLVNALYNFNLAKAQFAYGIFAPAAGSR